MTDGALLVTRKNGPLSSVLPVHATSIMRADPFASHGLVNVPSPLEPLGQSAGAALAVALGVGALADAEGAAEAVGAASADAGGLLSSLEQPRKRATITKA